MAQIESFITVKNNRAECYSFIKDNIKQFPDFIPNVRELKLTKELSPNKIVIEWTVDLGGALIKWEEEDIFDDETFSISFRALKGDFATYAGKWHFENAPDGTKIRISALFDWGIPNLGKHVGPVLEKKAKLNFKSMLLCIKKELNKGKF